MLTNIKYKREARKKRHGSLRKRVAGTAERPRLAVFRSAKHIYAQVIDDERGVTLAAASTLEGETKAKGADKAKGEKPKGGDNKAKGKKG